jgi:hypothetical protein
MVQAVRFRLMEPPPARDVIMPGRGGSPEEEPGTPQAPGKGSA